MTVIIYQHIFLCLSYL